MKTARLLLLAAACAGAALSCAAANALIGITPVTRSFEQAGGNAAITTSGSGSWTATTSASWITLTTSSGAAGDPIGYLVAANEGVEARTGVISVEGLSHTVTQAGVGANLDKTSASFEAAGGTGKVTVSAPAGKSWHAKSNVSWISVSVSTGTGAKTVTYTVAAYSEVSTRSGTLTIADNTFTVQQTGRRMTLREYSATTDFTEETIKIRITALADTAWTATTAASWATVVGAASGTGGGTVTVRVSKNENAKARTATVAVGTETFTITQLGTTNLRLALGSAEKAVGADGLTSERVSVEATDGLGWKATSDADWIVLTAGYASGTGSGSLVYKVNGNPTLVARSGVITVTASDGAVAAKRIEVSQEAAVAMLTIDGYAFNAVSETVQVGVSVPAIVGWSVLNVPSWMTVSGLSMVGPATLTLKVEANTSVKPRSATLRIADHDFAVTQKGRGVSVSYEAKVFDTDGKSEGVHSDNVITVAADDDVEWTAEVSDASWIVVYEGATGRGDGVVKYIVAPYVGDGSMRTGTITVGDQVVYVTQRPYDLSIEPNGTRVDGNSGAGEIQVALDIDGVWNAIASEPWVTFVSGYDAGTGSGKVLFYYTDNNTGKERVAKIVIAGEVYTLTQAARQNVVVSAEVEGHGGSVSGGGTYNVGSEVVLTAVAESGYRFAGWTLPDGSTATNETLRVTVAAAQTYVAAFEPVAPTLVAADASLKGVTLAWTNVAWATEYRVKRGTTEDRGAATLLATLANDGACRYLDATGAEGQSYWYWVEAVGVEDDVWSNGVAAKREKKSFAISYANLRGTAHGNPARYTEGETVTFAEPSVRRGYTFLGWAPSGITAETSGDVVARAVWKQNEYVVRFETDGADAAMADESFTYGFWRYLSETNFTRTGYVFGGWATEKGGAAAYADRASLKNLTAQVDGIVTLYAVWNALIGIENDNAAVVTGNDADGYVIRPSACVTDVAVRMPTGFDASKVVVEVGTDVTFVTPHGATIRIVRGEHDITGYLALPTADAAGRLDLSLAAVKDEIVKEAMDPEKGAKFEVKASEPTLTTSATKPGLTYTLREGTTLGGMTDGASKLGDGSPWTPSLKVKGGASGFYSIKVTK